jgi:hypothetical protein
MGVEVTIEFGKCLGGSFSALGRYFGSFLVLVAGWAFLGIAVFIATQGVILAAIEQSAAFRTAVADLGERGVELLSILPLAFVTIPGTVSMVGLRRADPRIVGGNAPQRDVAGGGCG